VYRSDDGGDTWSRVSRAIELRDEPLIVTAIACGDADASVHVATYESIHRSDDGGTSWATFEHPPAALVASLAVDPGDPTRLFAGQVVAGHRSEDRGESWMPFAMPALPFLGEPGYLLAFAFVPLAPAVCGPPLRTAASSKAWMPAPRGWRAARAGVRQAARADRAASIATASSTRAARASDEVHMGGSIARSAAPRSDADGGDIVPRYQKYTLGADLRDAARRALKLVVRADSRHSSSACAVRCVALEQLR
jgi:hypothetical protein